MLFKKYLILQIFYLKLCPKIRFYMLKFLLQGPQKNFGGPQFGHVCSKLLINNNFIVQHAIKGARKYIYVAVADYIPMNVFGNVRKRWNVLDDLLREGLLITVCFTDLGSVMRYDYFWVTFDSFWKKLHFFEAAGAVVKIGSNLK